MTTQITKNRRDFLNSVADVMEDDTFRDFFDTHFNDWDDCVAAIMMMKAYQGISMRNPTAEPRDIVKVLRECMKDADFRHQLANSMCSFMDQQLTAVKKKPKGLPKGLKVSSIHTLSAGTH